MAEILSRATYVALTMDSVSLSVTDKSYLVVTIHYSEGDELESLLLGSFCLYEVRGNIPNPPPKNVNQ